jgi:hypothetical protein
MMVLQLAHRYSLIFPVPGPKKGVIVVSGDRIASLSMDSRVKKTCHPEHHEREIISLLKRAYFTNPVDYRGFYSFGEHTAPDTLFTTTPERKTEPF